MTNRLSASKNIDSVEADALTTHRSSAGTDHADVVSNTVVVDRVPAEGSVATAMLRVAGFDFSDTNIVPIGADTYTAKTIPAAPKDFLIGIDIDATLANLVTAISTDGTETVVASPGPSGYMVLTWADAVGGTPAVGIPTSTVLTAPTITGGGTALWSTLNLNLYGAETGRRVAHGKTIADAALGASMIATTMAALGSLPFTGSAASTLLVSVTDTDGVPKAVTDKFALNAPAYDAVGVIGGAGAHIATTDIVNWMVIQ